MPTMSDLVDALRARKAERSLRRWQAELEARRKLAGSIPAVELARARAAAEGAVAAGEARARRQGLAGLSACRVTGEEAPPVGGVFLAVYRVAADGDDGRPLFARLHLRVILRNGRWVCPVLCYRAWMPGKKLSPRKRVADAIDDIVDRVG